ncbi:helix-turn-helix domain-containing protein [Kribbella sp. NPDC051770]|uniref:AraC-like ligand-binding domain-containing protein n=1 Tax=Kribbella sp. NPDC051770 TaxID=3155413 RepID=UPI00343DDEC6
MTVVAQGIRRAEWSTGEIDSWAEVVRDALVQVSARPARHEVFEGRMRQLALGELEFAVISSGAQAVDRTRRMIARADQDYLLANVQLQGQARIQQDGRYAVLLPGAIAFVDSARPYSLGFDGPFSQLIVRVPRSATSMPASATAVALDPNGPGRLVADFLVGLERTPTAALVPHAVGLLDSALDWAAGAAPSNTALTRERIHHFVRRHAAAPDLDAAAVAAGCGISRRTLYRALADDEPLSALIRRLRVNRAQQLLLSATNPSLEVVARASGFGGAAQLNRAFRSVTGTTPGAYRATGTNRQ